MNKNRKMATVYYAIAVLFYVVSIVLVLDEETRSTGITFLCLGSMWLCLGSVFLNRARKEDEQSDSEDERR